MTVFDATGTHTGPSDHLSAVPEISLIDHPQIEPLRAAQADAPRWLVGRDDDDLVSGTCGLIQGLHGTWACTEPQRILEDTLCQEYTSCEPHWAAQSVAVGCWAWLSATPEARPVSQGGQTEDKFHDACACSRGQPGECVGARRSYPHSVCRAGPRPRRARFEAAQQRKVTLLHLTPKGRCTSG